MKRQSVVPVLMVIGFLHSPAARGCDTWVASKEATRDGVMILAKNSDRPLFDCQPLFLHPRKIWKEGETIDLGRIQIPQVRETAATLGSSPYWCWGYEEGINEYGVSIGNEGVFTRFLAEDIAAAQAGNPPGQGLTGMDLVRLGLERGKTAQQAMEVIVSLLKQYGQFGPGVPAQGILGAYDNSYIIADPDEAWILETAGRCWIAKRVEGGIASISNTLSLSNQWDRIDETLIPLAREKGWADEGEFNFRQALNDNSDLNRARIQRADIRANRSFKLLDEKRGSIDTDWMKGIARDRNTDPGIDLSQTASSCISILPDPEKGFPVFWWAPAVPSSSCYVPFFVHSKRLPDGVSAAGKAGRTITPPDSAVMDSFDENSVWWIFRDLGDLVDMNRKTRLPVVRAAFDSLERSFQENLGSILELAARKKSRGQIKKACALLENFTAKCMQQALEKAQDLRYRLRHVSGDIPIHFVKLLGDFTMALPDGRSETLAILIQNERLALKLPNGTALELKDPDEKGIRRCVMAPQLGISFVERENEIKGLKVHQSVVLPRKADVSIEEEIPDSWKGVLGTYIMPVRNEEQTLTVRDGHLILQIPGQGEPEILPPDQDGFWKFADTDLYSLTFNTDSSGRTISMVLHVINILSKGKTSIW